MKNILLLFSKKAQIKYENELGEGCGIMLNETPKVRGQRVFAMLIIKAVITYLILFGCVDCYMSGFNIPYDYTLIAIACAIISIAFTFANTNMILMAIVYFLFLYTVSNIVNDKYDEVHSGVIAIINMSYDLIRNKYKLPSVDGFSEIVQNRGLTVPLVVILGAVILGAIVAFFVYRFMNLMLITLITMMPLGLVLFFDGKPSLSSFCMLVAAWILTAVIKFAMKYGRTRRRGYSTAYYYKDKIYYKQMCDGTVVLQCFVLLTLIGTIAVGAVHIMFNSDAFDSAVRPSKTKEQLDFVVRDTMIIAFSGYKGYRLNISGGAGKLGMYGDTRPDFETDLKVTLLPYTTDRTYLRSYIGSIYKYKANMWDNFDKDNSYVNQEQFNATAVAADDITAKIQVDNVASIAQNSYMPYYTDITTTDEFDYIQDDIVTGHLDLGENMTINYHPIMDYDKVNVNLSDEYRNYVYNNYLSVPKELKVKLASLCSGLGLNEYGKYSEEIDEKIESYFQDNFEYNMQSGMLPWKTDFVEYFLFETKSGVCAHFATAATLMYRSIGIPARYVEGYCIDYPAVIEGKPMPDYDVNEWLDGTTPLSKSVMQAELSDYNAHAWVEIYKDRVGWITVDPTPYVDPATLKIEEKKTSFLEDLMLYLADVNFEGAREDTASRLASAGLKGLKLILYAILLIAVYFITIRPIMWAFVRQYMAKRNMPRAVKMYFNYLKSIVAFCNVAKEDMLYRDFCDMLITVGMPKAEADKMLRIVEKAIYSRNSITTDEYVQLMGLIKKAKGIILKSTKIYKRLIVAIVAVK